MPNFKDTRSFIRDIAKIIQDNDLAEVEFKEGDIKIRVTRQLAQTFVQAAPQMAAAPVAAASGAAPEEAGDDDAGPEAGAVLSPMVGTVYTSPEPDAAAFVKSGDTVEEGQTILIIEAMKVMNKIPAPRSGTVRKVFVQDAQPVEFNDPLMIIE